MKEKYLEIAETNFEGKAKELVINQIELFYDNEETTKNKYSKGEDILLKKGTFIHGIFGGLENFDYTLQNGFISVDFTDSQRENKKKQQRICICKEVINIYSKY